MISGEFMYNAVSIVLAVAGLLSLFLVVRFLPDKRTKIVLVVALIMVVLSDIILPVAMRMYRFTIIVYAAEQLKKVEAGTVARWEHLCNIYLIGNFFELVAIGLFVGISKKLASLHGRTTRGEE